MASINETEQKILESAIEVFLEKGKEGAKMHDIANKAGINKALLHYYYRSKDKLYSFALRMIIRNIMKDTFLKTIGDSNLKESIRMFIDNYINRISQKPQIMNFIIWEIQQSHGKIITDIIMEKDETGVSIFERIITKIEVAKKNKEIIDIHPLHIYSSIIGLCAAPFFARPALERIFPDVEVSDEKFIAERKEFVFNMVWNYIGREEK
ncbi:MAG: TetR/AcrR family transcriptional regulator [Candidatus Cloacimonetes bacterium]|nr:TetR/AcrR family transcriptional regulator [Candidatus Cloacimonadota bacterium]